MAQQFACEEHQLRVPLRHDRLGLRGLGDHPHRRGGDPRGAHRARERPLVAGAHGDLLPRHQPARRTVHQVHAAGPQQRRQRARVVERPPPVGPVGARQAHRQRERVRPHGAHRVHHLQQDAHAVREGAAVAVGALVGERGQEAVQQVAVCGVQFDQLNARGVRAARGVGKGRHQAVDPRLVQRGHLGIAVAVAERRGAQHVAPAAGLREHRPAAFPRPVGAGLAPRVRQLDGGDGALRRDKVGDAPQRGHLRVVPQPQVVRRDAPLGGDGRGLGHHQPRPAGGEAAQVHQVPVGGEPVVRHVLAHGGDADAVAQRDGAQREGGEEGGHGQSGVSGGRGGRCGEARGPRAASGAAAVMARPAAR